MLSITGISGWITACLPPTARTVNVADGELVADVHRLPWRAQLSAVCGSAYSAACGLPSSSAGSRVGVDVVGVLMGDQDRVTGR